jgi:hypothetical protein
MKTKGDNMAHTVFKEICWYLGLTSERKSKFSESLYDTAVVSKEYVPENDNFVLGIAMGNPALGLVMSDDAKYNIRFHGKNANIELDDKKTFERFDDGDTVELEYKKIQKIIFDYMPPNWENKQEICRFPNGYIFVNAQKM